MPWHEQACCLIGVAQVVALILVMIGRMIRLMKALELHVRGGIEAALLPIHAQAVAHHTRQAGL